jgi:hypothetical protein
LNWIKKQMNEMNFLGVARSIKASPVCMVP